MSQDKPDDRNMHQELSSDHHDPLIRHLHSVIRICVKLLAVLMVVVIFFGVIDVAYVMYDSLLKPPVLLLSVQDIFRVFGAFMVVLIAVEIFINIRMYLGTSTLPVKLVIATALMAIGRKVIILDLQKTSAEYVFGIAAVAIALGIAYWLIGKTKKTVTVQNLES